ncbi:MAG: hypothetical protein KDC87_03965 [Planctomycetes bacterium]|nr:hypothetical protein [Planctomycetota bacterium]MCB9870130.1 hypothetical protein [Planctomycetota bacterium]
MLLLLPLACGILVPNERVPPQGWAKGRGPVIPHDTFPADCKLCHVGGSWDRIRDDFTFDHGARTGVELRGAHRAAECLRCHNDKGPVAKFASKGCAGCHEDWHRRQLGARCDTCHNETDWRPKEQIAQHARTRFPLIGAHAGVGCYACHAGAQVGNFKRASVRCEDCHTADLARTQSPNHVTAGWTRNCQQCHVPIAWKGSAFVHTTFPLTGSHTQTACTKCHIGGVYKGTNRTCEGCHLPAAQAVTDPDHVGAGWTSTCERCHSTISFKGANFVHDFFPLTGAHASQACTKCHIGGVYKGTPTTCVGCHLANYNATTSPNHAAASYPTTCESCHSTTTWKGAVFNHRFPRTGNHNVGCAVCHTTPNNYAVYNCLTCHEHRQAKMDDVHKGRSGYSYTSTACVRCHPNGR